MVIKLPWSVMTAFLKVFRDCNEMLAILMHHMADCAQQSEKFIACFLYVLTCLESSIVLTVLTCVIQVYYLCYSRAHSFHLTYSQHLLCSSLALAEQLVNHQGSQTISVATTSALRACHLNTCCCHKRLQVDAVIYMLKDVKMR